MTTIQVLRTPRNPSERIGGYTRPMTVGWANSLPEAIEMAKAETASWPSGGMIVYVVTSAENRLDQVTYLDPRDEADSKRIDPTLVRRNVVIDAGDDLQGAVTRTDIAFRRGILRQDREES